LRVKLHDKYHLKLQKSVLLERIISRGLFKNPYKIAYIYLLTDTS